MKVISFFIILFCFTIATANQNIDREKLTVQQAEMLVSVVMWHSSKNDPCTIFSPKASEIYEDKAKSSRFVDFMVGCRASNGDAFYSVDLYTGDIFNPSIECLEIKSKKLIVLQKKIRHSLHLTDIEYHNIKTKGPFCPE
jgi:hypothetical protein